MALIIEGKSRCVLCERVLAEDDAIFATTAFLDNNHPLWRFSDAAMHLECFLAWPQRTEFVAVYNEVWRDHPRRKILHEDGSLEVVPNPEFDKAAAMVIEASDRERQRRSSERQRLENEWKCKSRQCPRCNHEFESVQDKGACPSCHHVFHASSSRLLSDLSDIAWRDMTHAYGRASDVPGLLRALVSGDQTKRDKAFHELFGNIWHQGTVYEATVHALPFLIRLLADPDCEDRDSMAQLVASILAGQGYYEVHAESGARSQNDPAETLETERRIVTEVRRIGLDALPLLTPFLMGSEAVIRATVAEALACYPSQRELMLAHLQLALAHERDEEARERIQASLQRLASSS
jgi:hypothetical protein